MFVITTYDCTVLLKPAKVKWLNIRNIKVNLLKNIIATDAELCHVRHLTGDTI
mgnify:CR=1 FL=1